MKATCSIKKSGPFTTAIYTFQVGDVIDRHTHLNSGHLSIVTKGRILVRFNSKEITMLPGGVIYWPVGTEHEWEALEPSVLINVFPLLLDTASP